MIKATKIIPAIDSKEEVVEFDRVYVSLTEKKISYKTVGGERTDRALTDEVLTALQNAFVTELTKDATFKNISIVSAAVEPK